MTSSNDGDWEKADSLPTRPLLIEELTHIESQYGAKATTWIEVNIGETKRQLGLDDTDDEIIINFVIITDKTRYQYRFNGDLWVTKGPFSNESGRETWISEAGSLWTTIEKLKNKIHV
ncbi:hypothetical protein [Haloterrigena salina]|uniref:hypothetical protein n=1 Tax=Haloterrigena salina TaxID=504937 RepID=UPI0012686C6B|nr:hypothetical protein [Haloterrigena salina]